MIQEALLKDLLMQASAVKTSREAQFDIVLQCLVTRRGQHTIGIIALVENQSLEDDLVVDFDGFAIDGDAAQACIACHMVYSISGSVEQLHFQVVQVWVLRRP